MKVALFGATGFVGSYIVDELISQGMEANLMVREGLRINCFKRRNVG